MMTGFEKGVCWLIPAVVLGSLAVEAYSIYRSISSRYSMATSTPYGVFACDFSQPGLVEFAFDAWYDASHGLVVRAVDLARPDGLPDLAGVEATAMLQAEGTAAQSLDVSHEPTQQWGANTLHAGMPIVTFYGGDTGWHTLALEVEKPARNLKQCLIAVYPGVCGCELLPAGLAGLTAIVSMFIATLCGIAGVSYISARPTRAGWPMATAIKANQHPTA